MTTLTASAASSIAPLLRANRGEIAGNPISSEIELAEYLKRLCNADGYRVENNRLLALRWDADGNEVIVDRFRWGV